MFILISIEISFFIKKLNYKKYIISIIIIRNIKIISIILTKIIIFYIKYSII